MDRRRILWIEFAVVLTLFWLPVTVSGLSAYFFPSITTASIGWESEVGRLVSNIAVIVPLLFIIYASADDPKSFGLKLFGVAKTILLAIATLVVLRFSYALVYVSLHAVTPDSVAISRQIARHNVGRPIPGPAIWVFRLLIFLLSAFEEELIWRGYTLTRLNELLGNRWAALIVSSALFAIYHIYEGLTFLPIVFVHGIIFGLVRTWSGSLAPGTLAHTIYNCLSMAARTS
ncbi:MAG TPA: CPBP family intramembrane glutamic endopeptidase [Fimbriimonadaceae bacterium]|nr:CPBP family intramembrane glutamic endopeptidase [Fimbriimonadaceae bacterium]